MTNINRPKPSLNATFTSHGKTFEHDPCFIFVNIDPFSNIPLNAELLVKGYNEYCKANNCTFSQVLPSSSDQASDMYSSYSKYTSYSKYNSVYVNPRSSKSAKDKIASQSDQSDQTQPTSSLVSTVTSYESLVANDVSPANLSARLGKAIRVINDLTSVDSDDVSYLKDRYLCAFVRDLKTADVSDQAKDFLENASNELIMYLVYCAYCNVNHANYNKCLTDKVLPLDDYRSITNVIRKKIKYINTRCLFVTKIEQLADNGTLLTREQIAKLPYKEIWCTRYIMDKLVN